MASRKSFVPQFVRLLRKLAVYGTKHQATMAPYLTTSQQTALQNVITAAQAFSGVDVVETP